jgi:hypothetical protein
VTAPTRTAPPLSTVHLLTVHGVGGHDHLSNLLRTYQSFRANLTSVEAPVTGEDQIPGWRLVTFEEGSTPPFVELQPRVTPPDGVGTVRVYEVNYSGFAGVLRRNHRIDLTDLFVGLDLATCAARLRPRTGGAGSFAHHDRELGVCLQRVAGVLAAGTVPILGLPAIAFRNYLGTFIATFTRFFEDVATFVLDKNGEQLISAHFDRVLETIARGMQPGDRLVISAHSLGSVVAHNYVVRHWTTGQERLPDTLVTFGSPIGLLTWIWLFLDFTDMDFGKRLEDSYFCWNPISAGATPRAPLEWINVLNCGDPIATAFPVGAIDLSLPEATIAAALKGGTIAHRFFGPDTVSSVGGAHTRYLRDKNALLAILLRASRLALGEPEQVASGRSAAEHWEATDAVLRRTQWILVAATVVLGVGYFEMVARTFHDQRLVLMVIFFAWPPLTIGTLAFGQRLVMGGPTKRIEPQLIREMPWQDRVALPYRLRDALLRSREIDPMAPGRGYLTRLAIQAWSFFPTLVMMAIPVVLAASWTDRWPTWTSFWLHLRSAKTLIALGLFMAYVAASAAFELVRAWRDVVRLATSDRP